MINKISILIPAPLHVRNARAPPPAGAYPVHGAAPPPQAPQHVQMVAPAPPRAVAWGPDWLEGPRKGTVCVGGPPVQLPVVSNKMLTIYPGCMFQQQGI